MRRYVPKQRLFHKGSDALQAALDEARALVESRAGRAPAATQRPARPPPGVAAAAAAAGAAGAVRDEQADADRADAQAAAAEPLSSQTPP